MAASSSCLNVVFFFSNLVLFISIYANFKSPNIYSVSIKSH